MLRISIREALDGPGLSSFLWWQSFPLISRARPLRGGLMIRKEGIGVGAGVGAEVRSSSSHCRKHSSINSIVVSGPTHLPLQENCGSNLRVPARSDGRSCCFAEGSSATTWCAEKSARMLRMVLVFMVLRWFRSCSWHYFNSSRAGHQNSLGEFEERCCPTATNILRILYLSVLYHYLPHTALWAKMPIAFWESVMCCNIPEWHA